MLHQLYPWFAAIPDSSHRTSDSINSQNTKYTLLYDTLRDVNKRIRRLVHQSLSDLIDPSRSYTSTMLLNAVMGYGSTGNLTAVGKKSKALQSSEAKVNHRGRFYRTSPSILALFGDAGNPETRKFLQRNAPLYTPIPGAVMPFEVKLDKVKEWGVPDATKETLSRTQTASTRPGTNFSTTANRPNSTLSMNSTNRPGSSFSMTGTRPGTQQSMEDGLSPLKERRSKKKLDFHRLFESQPEANYYPPEMYGEDTLRPDENDISFHPDSEVSTDLRINDILETADAVEKQITEIKNRKVYDSNILPFTLPLDVPKHKSDSSSNVGGFKTAASFIEDGANVLRSTSRSKLAFVEEKRSLQNANYHSKNRHAQRKNSIDAANQYHKAQSSQGANGKLILSSSGKYVHESQPNYAPYTLHKQRTEQPSLSDDQSLNTFADTRSLVHNKSAEVIYIPVSSFNSNILILCL